MLADTLHTITYLQSPSFRKKRICRDISFQYFNIYVNKYLFLWLHSRRRIQKLRYNEQNRRKRSVQQQKILFQVHEKCRTFLLHMRYCTYVRRTKEPMAISITSCFLNLQWNASEVDEVIN